MDTLLLLGVQNEKLLSFLKRVGYQLIVGRPQEPLLPQWADRIIDLIVIDSSGDADGLELCRFFRSENQTRDVPIVYLAKSDREMRELRDDNWSGIEALLAESSPGVLVSRIATNLRLRKMAGADEDKASLGEINAKLRDLNQHFQKELREAREIQNSLVPADLPQDERFELALFYKPLEEVGGDWYFFESDRENRMAVQIADVTGHGLSAAFIGSITKLAKIAAGQEPPAELLADMNRLMSSSIPPGRFVTAFSYLYDPATGQLLYARAGHPPALLCRCGSGTVDQLMGDGFALGFFEDGEYQSCKDELAPGDLLLVFTDGIPEAQNRQRQNYGYERMAALLASAPAEEAAEKTLSRLVQDFTIFLDGRLLKDDLTAILLKRIA